jgi:hypothetical protein
MNIGFFESPLRQMHTCRSCCETRAGLATGAGFFMRRLEREAMRPIISLNR